MRRRSFFKWLATICAEIILGANWRYCNRRPLWTNVYLTYLINSSTIKPHEADIKPRSFSPKTLAQSGWFDWIGLIECRTRKSPPVPFPHLRAYTAFARLSKYHHHHHHQSLRWVSAHWLTLFVSSCVDVWFSLSLSLFRRLFWMDGWIDGWCDKDRKGNDCLKGRYIYICLVVNGMEWNGVGVEEGGLVDIL